MSDSKLRKIRKINDIRIYLKKQNVNISNYKLRKLFLERKISGLRLDNNFYFYLDDVEKYFNL